MSEFTHQPPADEPLTTDEIKRLLALLEDLMHENSRLGQELAAANTALYRIANPFIATRGAVANRIAQEALDSQQGGENHARTEVKASPSPAGTSGAQR